MGSWVPEADLVHTQLWCLDAYYFCGIQQVFHWETWSLASVSFIMFSQTHYYSTVLYGVIKVAHILQRFIKCTFSNNFHIYLSVSPYYISILDYPLKLCHGMAIWEALPKPDSSYLFNSIMFLKSRERDSESECFGDDRCQMPQVALGITYYPRL